MRIRARKSISFLLAMIVFLTALYFDNIQAHAVSLYSPVEKTDLNVSFIKDTISKTNLCTTEMLGIYSNISTRQLSSQYINQRRELRCLLEFVPVDKLFITPGKFYTISELMHLYDLHQEEIVLHFIHNSDGKKRV